MEQTSSYIDFHILDYNIKHITKTTLLQYIALYPNAQLFFHSISPSRYALFTIAERFPELTTALYLAHDTCVHGDITHLFSYDLEGYAFGVVSADMENIYISPASHMEEHKIASEIPIESTHFTLGLVVLNCTYWRKHAIEQQCQAYIRAHSTTLSLEHILHTVLELQFIYLPIHLLFLSDEYSKEYSIHITSFIESAPCSVIYYHSVKKPWNTSQDTLLLSSLWLVYAKLTPFYIDFSIEYLKLQTKTILEYSQSTYIPSTYECTRLYWKYKFTSGAKRQYYKAQHRALKDIRKKSMKAIQHLHVLIPIIFCILIFYTS